MVSGGSLTRLGEIFIMIPENAFTGLSFVTVADLL